MYDNFYFVLVIKLGDMFYCLGVIGIWLDGLVFEDFEEQFIFVFQGVEVVLKEVGFVFNNVVEMMIYYVGF